MISEIKEIGEDITIFNKEHYKGLEVIKDINIFNKLRLYFALDLGIRPDKEDRQKYQLAFFNASFTFRLDKEGIDSEENLCRSEGMTLFGKEGCFTWLDRTMNYFHINADYGDLNRDTKEPYLEVKIGTKNLITL